MILGMSTSLFTQIHVAISLIAIASGLVAALGMIVGKLLRKVTTLFLVTTILTSITGFLFPYHGTTPGIVVGIVSLIVLLITVISYYGKHQAGGWRRVYVFTAMFALYLNCFVLVAQGFQKIPALHALAPTGAEPAFKFGQVAVLVIFIALTIAVDRKYRGPVAPLALEPAIPE
jgi:hypothetical protein